MKKMKKLASLLLAAVMVLAMAVAVFAADTTISAPDGSTRTYDVYQIFTGDLSGGVLSNVKWGKNGTVEEGTTVSDETLEALAAVNSLSDTAKLDVIKKYVDLSGSAYGTVSSSNALKAPTGYYLIKDNGSVQDGEGYSLYVVQVVGPTTISPKVGTTTSEKKVDDKNDSNTSEDGVSWQDSADYDIGDAVPFQLKAIIAQDYANYKAPYKLTFHDKEEAGLTFDSSTVKVYVDGEEITSGYEVVTSGLKDRDTFEVRFANLKDISSVAAGSVITVEYTSTLNEKAVIGATGNKNTMHITYSNNPNDEQGSENGKTPEDTVIVFTYKVVVNKVQKNPDYDSNDEDSDEYIPLEGAGFTLYKKNSSGEWIVVGEELKGNKMTTFTWERLDDGDYKLSETTTPAGFNTIADIEFTVAAEHSTSSATPELISLSGNTESGVVFAASESKDSLTTQIENKSGATLPSTGGIGTTIFYVLGSILVIAAAILLITRKRMSAQK